MKRDQLKDSFTQYLNEEIPPDTIHLWAGLKRSLVAKRQLSEQQGDLQMKNYKHLSLCWTKALPVMVVVLLVGALLISTPQGRAFAQDIVKLFTRLDQNQQAAPQLQASLEPHRGDLVASEPADDLISEEGCGSIISPRCDMASVQAEVLFKVYGFSTVPEGVVFIGAMNLSNGIAIKYSGDHGELLLFETLVDENSASTWTIGSSASIQSTNVNQYPAEFVQGAWSGLPFSGEFDSQLTWDESLPARTLRWQIEEIDYTLINFPARGVNGPLGYDLMGLKRLAETIGEPGAVESLSWQEEGITLAGAEAQAGFSFSLTAKIPVGLGLYKTTYNSQYNAICQYYRSKNDDLAAPALVIAQSTWALPGMDDLQSKAYFGDQPVTLAASEEVLPLRGANGGLGTLIETGLQVEAYCGGTMAMANRALLWQKDDRSYVLFGKLDSFAGTGYVSKLELQQIAASLNGVTIPIDSTDLDPERLKSLNDAESVANMEISQPAVMLSNMRFDHISVGSMMGSPFMVVTQYIGNELTLNGVERVLVFQTNHSTASLDELRLAGGYVDVQVKGMAAIYNEQCSQEPGYGTFCNQILSWFEGDTQYDIIAYTTAVIPVDTMLAIANNLR